MRTIVGSTVFEFRSLEAATAFFLKVEQPESAACPHCVDCVQRGCAMTSPAGEGGTVLVVDDYEDIRELVRMGLQIKGYRVVEAENGREAIELAARVHPDLILMDLSMPEMDGYEATRRLKANPESSRIPVVAVSAFCDSHKMHEALAAGCDECVSKPVDLTLLNELVMKYLPRGH